jgi:hypothetical protein
MEPIEEKNLLIARPDCVEHMEALQHIEKLNYETILFDLTESENAPHVCIIGLMIHLQKTGKNIKVMYKHLWLADLLQNFSCIVL